MAPSHDLGHLVSEADIIASRHQVYGYTALARLIRIVDVAGLIIVRRQCAGRTAKPLPKSGIEIIDVTIARSERYFGNAWAAVSFDPSLQQFEGSLQAADSMYRLQVVPLLANSFCK
jgi:hypothetical protein